MLCVELLLDSQGAQILSDRGSKLTVSRYLDILENPEQKVMRFYRRIEPQSIIPRMTPSTKLEELTCPHERQARCLLLHISHHGCIMTSTPLSLPVQTGHRQIPALSCFENCVEQDSSSLGVAGCICGSHPLTAT